MHIKIIRIDPTLPLPKYHTNGSVAFDLYVRKTTTVPPFCPTIVPSNIIVEVPKGYFLMLASRSSTPLKKGIMLANGIGVIDQDYQGNKDEIGVQLLNFTQHDIVVKRGERIAQAILVNIAKVESFTEVSTIKTNSRGGFGSTG